MLISLVVSPLHDRELSNTQKEVFFDRATVDKDTATFWEPYWHAMDEIKSSGVRVWEGEGPGFRRQRITNTMSRAS